MAGEARPCGRLIEFDPRSMAYYVRLVTPLFDKPRHYVWSPGLHDSLDQQRDGACVACGWLGELAARPVVVGGIHNGLIRPLYYKIQKNDQWPGGAYLPPTDPEFYEGTSVVAGARTLKTMGFYGEYRWAFNEDDMARANTYHGPCVIGINWKTGMMQPDSNGFIKDTGVNEGGHCVVSLGLREHNGVECYVIRQSWGEWGVPITINGVVYRGCAYMPREVMARSLEDKGECCVPTIRTRPVDEVWNA